MNGNERLARKLRERGWVEVAPLSPNPSVPGESRAVGKDPGGTYRIWIDGGRDGYIEGYSLDNIEANKSTGRVPWSRGVPTPEEAVGRWEEQRAREATP